MTGSGNNTRPTMGAMPGLLKTGRQGMKQLREMAAAVPEDEPEPAERQTTLEITARPKR
jgi:hypothetical protein